MCRRRGKGRVSGDQPRVEGLGECHVHRVVRREVVAQFPRATEEVCVSVAADIEMRQVVERLLGSAGRQLPRPDEPPARLHDLTSSNCGVCESSAPRNGRASTRESGFSLKEQLRQRRGVNDDDAESRSSRITRRRLCCPCPRVTESGASL